MKFGLKPAFEKKIIDYIYALFAREFSKSIVKKFDGGTKLKFKDLGFEGEALSELMFKRVENHLAKNRDLGDSFNECLASILYTIAQLPAKKEVKTKNIPKKTTEFADFRNILKTECDKIVFYPKGRAGITFTNPVLIKTIIDSMGRPSPHFEASTKRPFFSSEIDLMEFANTIKYTYYTNTVVLLRNDIAQLLGLFNAKQSQINLVTHELLEIAGAEKSNKSDKAKISYIQKKCSSSGN